MSCGLCSGGTGALCDWHQRLVQRAEVPDGESCAEVGRLPAESLVVSGAAVRAYARSESVTPAVARRDVTLLLCGARRREPGYGDGDGYRVRVGLGDGQQLDLTARVVHVGPLYVVTRLQVRRQATASARRRRGRS